MAGKEVLPTADVDPTPRKPCCSCFRSTTGALAITAVFIFFLSVGISVLLFLSARETDLDATRREFVVVSDGTSLAIAGELDSYLEAELHSGQALARDNGTFLTLSEFSLHSNFLRAIRPGVNSVHVCPRVTRDDRATFEAEYLGGFPIAVVDLETRNPVPAPDVPLLYPLAYSVLRPEAENSTTSLDGIDLYTMPPLRGPFDASVRSGACQTAKYYSIVDGLRLLGGMCPIYSQRISAPFDAYPEETLLQESFGVIILTMRTEFLVDTTVFSQLPEDTIVQVEDLHVDDDLQFGNASGVVLLINDHSRVVSTVKNSRGIIGTVPASEFEASTVHDDMVSSHDFKFGNRDFRVTMKALIRFKSSRETGNPEIILASGLVVSVIVVAGLVAMAWCTVSRDHARAAVIIADERSKRLMAQAAKEAHEQTLGYACHELRNPLHAISASAEFLLENVKPSEPAFEDLQAIVTGAQQMHRLVNDVLDWGKLKAGKLTLSPMAFALRSTVAELLALHQSMCQPGVQLGSAIHPDVPDMVILDNLRIRQLISNGLTNALKSTKSGAVLVQVRSGEMMVPGSALDALRAGKAVDTQPHGEGSAVSIPDAAPPTPVSPPVSTQCLLFEVIDTGVGLRGTNPVALFEPYTQVSPQSKAFTARSKSQQYLAPACATPNAMRAAAVVRLPIPVSESKASAQVPARAPVSVARRRQQGGGAAGSSHAKAGSGLGLPICKQLVSLMCGEVGLEERPVVDAPFPPEVLPPDACPAQVTAFWFAVPLTSFPVDESIIPLVDSLMDAFQEVQFTSVGSLAESGGEETAVVPAPSKAQPPELDAAPPGLPLAEPGRRKRSAGQPKLNLSCLVVDDESVNRRVCGRMLGKLGCTFTCLEDGDQVEGALRESGYGDGAAPQAPFDVILLDIMMERSNGVDVLHDLQAAFREALPPCVAVTGNTSVQDVTSYLEAGFGEVLAKPFNATSLRTALVKVASRSGSFRILASPVPSPKRNLREL